MIEVCNYIEIYNLYMFDILFFKSRTMGCLLIKPVTDIGYAVKCVEVASVRVGTPFYP